MVKVFTVKRKITVRISELLSKQQDTCCEQT